MSDGDETTVVEPVAAAAAVGSDESGLTRRKPTEAAATTTTAAADASADATATATKPTKRKKKTAKKKLTPEERQARLERLSKAREARHDFLLGNRTRPEVRADRGEAPAPAKFTPLPGTAEAAQAEQAEREREAALAAAAGAGGGLASLGPMFGAATSSSGGGDAGAAGAAGGGGVAATVARVALLQRLLCAVLGVAVALWPSVDAAGLEAEVTPASRLWLYLIPLFVAIQLMGRRVLHFLGAAVPGAAGALFAVKVAASDFTTTFGAFWIAHMVLKASFDAWYFDPGEPPADHDAGRMGALPPQEL